MKYFILTFIIFVSLLMLASCGLVISTEGAPTTEQRKLAVEYGGIYVFDKALRDEIIQRKKEREEYKESYLETIDKEKGKLLRTFFTEKEIQDYEDMIERDKRRRGVVISYSYHPVYKKEQEILKELNKKYPYSLIDEKFPEIYSYTYQYCPNGLSVQDKETELAPYMEKIKEYMGEENWNKLDHCLEVHYIVRNVDGIKKKIIISLFLYRSWYQTIFELDGDEAAGITYTKEEEVWVTNYRNIFYLINDKFVKYERED